MRPTARRTIAALMAGSALVLSTAASCGPTGGEDDDTPGVVQEEGDDEGDD